MTSLPLFSLKEKKKKELLLRSREKGKKLYFVCVSKFVISEGSYIGVKLFEMFFLLVY